MLNNYFFTIKKHSFQIFEKFKTCEIWEIPISLNKNNTMKKQLLFICLILFISCKKTETINKVNIENQISNQNNNIALETISKKNSIVESQQNIENPKRSKIINSKFELELLFGIWTNDPKGPHADFDLNEKYFYVVDYDGNGDMPYIINQDTIKVFYKDFTSIGIINNVTKDSLLIDWDGNGISKYVKWKN